jgi:eukaryotic-like serine/threonine-protein kinase
MSASQLPTVRGSSAEQATITRGPGEAPLVLGRYRLYRRLGTGAFGTVWEARDARLDRDVAVKILPRERIVGGRFEREARAAARLAHPGIVTLYEAAVDDEGAYLVSELVRGATLSQLLEAGLLSDRDILAAGVALCDALTHAHSQGIIHRDVKPSNVLVPDRPTTSAQIARLTDFGVARVIGGDSLTRTGDVIGTAAYMAPEQAEGREAGAAADLYALAVVLYEALAGTNPVPSGTSAQRARRLGAYLAPLRRQRRDLPRELGAGIDLALRPRPRERGSLEELRRALIAVLPQVADVPGVITGAWPRPPITARPAERDEREPFAEPTAPPPRREAEDHDPEPGVAASWPTRGLAALAIAGLAAWLSARVSPTVPIPAAAVGLVAAALVLILPRAGWLLTVVSLAVTAIAGHRPGAAVVVTVGGLVPLALLPRAASTWPLAAGAPALGLLGLGGAWPALAARASGAWHRAALGALGWVWLALAAPLAGADLYLRRPSGTPQPSVWAASLHQTVAHVLAPLASSGVLAAAPAWGLAAVVLPWMVRGGSLGRDALGAVIWATALVSSTGVILAVVAVGSGGMERTALIGAAASAAIALAPTAIRALRAGRESQAGLA